MRTHLSFTGIKIAYCIYFFLFNSICYPFICINIPPPICENAVSGIHLRAVHSSTYRYLHSSDSPHVLNMYYRIISNASIASNSYYLIQYFFCLGKSADLPYKNRHKSQRYKTHAYFGNTIYVYGDTDLKEIITAVIIIKRAVTVVIAVIGIRPVIIVIVFIRRIRRRVII